MSYCINPWCLHRCNPNQNEFCQSCGASLTINERYQIVKPLRELNQHHHTEIFEIDNLGTTKVLKVLTSDRRRLVELFKQEVAILKQLNHLGVPCVDTCFTFSLPDSQKQLYCLVMEKMPGQNLEQWLAENKQLSEGLALDWLWQLSEFLKFLHLKQILHRDIKPANIMLRPDGKLILIDFGTARNITATYVGKLSEGDITRIYTSGYTAPEQVQGQAVYQSDYFALGRSFIHLLTGIHPDHLPPNQETGQLIWRDRAPQISTSLGDLIDGLIAPLPQERLPQPQLAIEKLKIDYQKQETKIGEFSGGQKKLFYPPINLTLDDAANSWFKFGKVVLASMAIALLIIGIRSLGLLQPFELQAFDHLMQLRPIEQQDPRLLLITIDEADIQYQNQQKMSMRWSLSDQALLQLLDKLEQYEPRTIAIDIYRDFEVDSNYPELANRLSSDSRFFAPCKVPAPEDGDLDGIPSPPEIPISRIGFSDFVADRNEVVRRHLLHLTPSITSPCAAEYALGVQVALHYLHGENINSTVTADGQLKIGEVLLPQLTRNTNGYQNIDASGYQILLNYRSLRSYQDIAQQIPLREILEDKIDTDLIESVKDRIVIIGVTASSIADYWSTPERDRTRASSQKIPGLMVQTQAISQILSAVLDQRPLIWWWSGWIEAFWLWFWSLLGGIVAWYFVRPWHLGIAIAGAYCLLFSLCFAIFRLSGWIPLVPPALGLLATSMVTLFLVRRYRLQ